MAFWTDTSNIASPKRNLDLEFNLQTTALLPMQTKSEPLKCTGQKQHKNPALVLAL